MLKRQARLELIVISALFSWMALSAAANEDAREAHRYADGVLHPRFHAAFNDWSYQHPSKEGHEGGLDVGDRKRWQVVRESFRDLDEAYKRAGY